MAKVLITGTSSGIGKVAKEYFCAKNYHVIGVSRTEVKRDEYYQHFTFDLKEITKISELIRNITIDNADIDTVILNAGFGIFKELDQFSETEIIELLNVNLLANILITKALLPILRNKVNSKIIFIGSESGLEGQKKGSIYCASKFGLRGFVLSLQKELSKNNTQASIINPGMVKSDFFNSLNFTHGEKPENYINPMDIIKIIDLTMEVGNFCLVEEINLQPYKKVIIKK